ncbi:MAG: DUF5063 domain-containing protein [Myxococcota bacterium]
MDPLELFAELTRDFCSIVLQGHGFTLEDRVVSVDAGLARVLAAGVTLPIVPGTVPADPSSPFDEAAWPGFGSYERYWTVGELAQPGEPIPCQMSQTLRFVFGQLWVGLEQYEERDTERAAGTWGRGYEDSWGPAATELLHALHPAVRGYREDARRRVQQRRRGSQVLEMVAPRPVEPAPEPRDRPMLGVRFEACDGGVAVVAVHPQGPAAGALIAGDIVLSVDGRSLADLSGEAAGAEMVGPIGESRRYEVWRDGATVVVDLASIGAQEMP